MGREKAVPRSEPGGRILVRLFLNMLHISTFTFGGGFVIITLMKRKFVDELGWMEEGEMLDYAALAQSSPGAIAVNAAILVGWRMAGVWGMITAVTGTILPPMVILSAVSVGYSAFAGNAYVAMALSGMQAAVAAVILDVVFTLGESVWRERSAVHMAVMAAAFMAACFLRVNVVVVILAAAVTGICARLAARRKERAA